MQEDFDWAVKVIESCTNKFHLECIPGIIDLFYTKHQDERHKNILLDYLMEKEIKINVDA